MRFMSDFREAMWASSERHLRARLRLRGYGAKHFGRLSEAGADPRFEQWLRRRMAPARELPDSARCVIIGGGVGGTSIAYHLGQLGWSDVVLLERNQLTSGSTFHSAGLAGQLRGSVSLTKMMMYSVDLTGASARSRSSTPAGPSAAASGWPRARRAWMSCAARRAGRRPSGCRSS